MEKPRFVNPTDAMGPKHAEMSDDLEESETEFGKQGAAANTGSQAGPGRKKGSKVKKPFGMKG